MDEREVPALASALSSGLGRSGTRSRWSDGITLPAGLSLVLGLALGGLALASLTLLASDALPARPYGDGDVFAQFVREGRAMPRWLLGSAAAATLHAALWEFPPVRAALPVGFQSSTAFLALLGTAVMAVGTVALWRQWPGRLHVMLPALTPIWALFLSGYVEYYPLIAVPLVAVLAWTFDRPLETRSPRQIGIVTGLLPVIYIGFAPLSLGLGLAWAAARRSGVARALGTAVLTALLTIALCWPEGMAHYFRALYLVFNFGDLHATARYAGQVSGPESIFFSTSAALSASHLGEVAQLLVWGGGWWSLPAVVALAAAAMSRGVSVPWRDARVWLGVAITLWQVTYLIFMVPRLGPVADVDLFFATYLWLAFLAGLLLDARRVDGRHDRWAWSLILVAMLSLAWTAPRLVWHGLPQF